MMYSFTDKNVNSDCKHIISDIGNSETIDSTFSTFIDKICDTLKEEDFRKVKRSCLQNNNVPGGLALSKDTQDKIENAKDFDDLFDTLIHTPYWNWMNIRLLERMVGNCIPAKELIHQYKIEVYSKKLKDVLSEISILNVPTDEYTKIQVKCVKDFNDVTIGDVVKKWNEIEERFNVKESMLLESIAKGCVEICLLLPNGLVEHAISSAHKNQLAKRGDQLAIKELFPDLLYLKFGEVVMKDIIIGM